MSAAADDDGNKLPPNPAMPALFRKPKGTGVAHLTHTGYVGDASFRGGFHGYYSQYWIHSSERRQRREGVKEGKQAAPLEPTQPGRDPLVRVTGQAPKLTAKEDILKDVGAGVVDTTSPEMASLVGPEIVN